MRTVGRFYYSESSELDAKILRIPYDVRNATFHLLHLEIDQSYHVILFQGHKFAMYLILPRSRNGIEQLINEINPYILARYSWQMQDLPVDVSIPKFKFEFSNHLEDILREVRCLPIAVFDNALIVSAK